MVKTIKQIMTKEVITLDKNRLVKEAVDIMAKKSLSCVVITEKDKPVGIITERDMVKKILRKGLNINKIKLKSVMSSPPITITPDIDIFTAAQLMRKHKIRRLVITHKNKLRGLITENDIGSLITDVSIRSIFHRMNLKKDLEIAKLRNKLKELEKNH